MGVVIVEGEEGSFAVNLGRPTVTDKEFVAYLCGSA